MSGTVARDTTEPDDALPLSLPAVRRAGILRHCGRVAFLVTAAILLAALAAFVAAWLPVGPPAPAVAVVLEPAS